MGCEREFLRILSYSVPILQDINRRSPNIHNRTSDTPLLLYWIYRYIIRHTTCTTITYEEDTAEITGKQRTFQAAYIPFAISGHWCTGVSYYITGTRVWYYYYSQEQIILSCYCAIRFLYFQFFITDYYTTRLNAYLNIYAH